MQGSCDRLCDSRHGWLPLVLLSCGRTAGNPSIRVLEDPLAYWQKLTEKAGIPAKPDAVEATLLLATTRGLLLDLCATGDRARVERAMEALAQFGPA